MWSSLPTSTAAARALRMHRPPRSTMCCSLATCRAELGSHLPSRSKGKGAAGSRRSGIKSHVPCDAGNGRPSNRVSSFSQLAQVSVPWQSLAMKERGAKGSLCPAARAVLKYEAWTLREAGSH